ncbi:C40 family peptidase [Brevibacillus fluminis]|uniref:C40 family peptidase n=1 Tax=Brevibacillus fluminis TaxID=511487 RepID=UPI003F8B3FFD
MKKVIAMSSVLAASLLFSGIATAAASNQYTIKANDTLWLIASKYTISLSSLMAANPNVSPTNLIVGSSIAIPAQKTQQWSEKADAIIATGMTQLGVPYVFGGDQPGVAFDCSGFIQYIFNQNGYHLPHSSSMISEMGTPVAKSQLRKGDLVFLSGTYQEGVSHVALYLGDNKVLQAGTKGGVRNVKISTFFGDPYYDAHYWGAKRIITD